MRIVLLITCFLCSLQTITYSQEKFTDNLKVMVNYQHGVAIPEYTILSKYVTDISQAVDVAIFKERHGENEYEQMFNYPEVGAAFYFVTLGNSEVLGEAYAVNYFYRYNLIRKNNFKLYNRMGIGLGYLTRKWDLVDNPENVAIGSNLNIHWNFRLGASYEFFDKFSLNAGISFDHFSNANTARPNFGLNYLALHGGIIQRIGRKIEPKIVEKTKHERTHSWEVILSFGGKDTRSFSNKYYPTFSLGGEYHFHWFKALDIGAGVDFFYDTSIQPQFEDDNKEFKSHYSYQSGIHVSQSVVYRKFRFTLQEGFYIGLTNRIFNRAMYSRGILKYFINDHWSARIAMKSHLHILDHPEIGFGYKF